MKFTHWNIHSTAILPWACLALPEIHNSVNFSMLTSPIFNFRKVHHPSPNITCAWAVIAFYHRGHSLIYFLTLCLPLHDISHKRNHTGCGVLWWLLSQSSLSGFISIAAHISTPWIFIDGRLSLAWLHHTVCIRLLDRRLSFSPSFDHCE